MKIKTTMSILMIAIMIIAGLAVLPTASAKTRSSAPSLDSYWHTPGYQPKSDTHINFHCNYSQAENLQPDHMLIFIDDWAYNMTWASGSHDIAAVYNFTKRLDQGNHTYYYWTSCNGSTDRLPASGHFDIHIEGSGPKLNGGTVDPYNGDTNTWFDFQATYTDYDGDMPTYIHVLIDDIPHNMTLNGSDAKTGIIGYFSTKLTKGNHTYEFEARSADGKTVEIGGSDLYVSDAVQQHAPQLYNAARSVSQPKVGQYLFFNITYKDLDNDAPTTLDIIFFWDEQPAQNYTIQRSMNISGTSYLTGVHCSVLMYLPHAGNWSYHYYAYEGQHSAYDPINGSYLMYVYPGSQQTSPSLKYGSVSPYYGYENATLFNFTVTYVDGQMGAPTHMWVHIGHAGSPTSGNTYAMSEITGDYGSEGVAYIYSTYLPDGNFTHYFLAYTGSENITYPASGEGDGPVVYPGTPTNHAPDVSVFASPIDGDVNTTFHFWANATDRDGDALSYFWIFSDGMNSTGSYVTRVFYTAGYYTATVAVTDTHGASTTATISVHVGSGTPSDRPPVAKSNLQYLSYVKKGETKTISAAGSYDPDGDQITYQWNVTQPSGSTSFFKQMTFNFTFDLVGNYSLTQVLRAGGMVTLKDYVIYCHNPAQNQPPIARAAATVTGMTVLLHDSGSYDPDGHITSYLWTLTDGNGTFTYSSQYLNHTYKTKGYKTAILTVTDSSGATDSDVVGFTVGTSTKPHNPNETKKEVEVVIEADVAGDAIEGAEVKIVSAEEEIIITVEDVEKDSITFTLDSETGSGKLVILNIDTDVLDMSEPDRVVITLDGMKVKRATFDEIVHADGDEPLYYILTSESGSQLLVYTPESEETSHTLEASLKDEGHPPLAGAGIVITLLVVIVVGLLIAMVLLLVQIRRRKEMDEYYEDFNVADEVQDKPQDAPKTNGKEEMEWEDFL